MDPVLVAIKFSHDYFALNKKSFRDGLAENVEFLINATLYPHTGPPTSLSKEVTGVDNVMEGVLNERHFGAVEKLTLNQISFRKITSNIIVTEFVTIETKREGSSSMMYKYVGAYEVQFDENMKAIRVSLTNTRYCL